MKAIQDFTVRMGELEEKIRKFNNAPGPQSPESKSIINEITQDAAKLLADMKATTDYTA